MNYPSPIPPEQIEALVSRMIADGMIDAGQRDRWTRRYHIKLRLRQWLQAMGVEPTKESRRAYVEGKRQSLHDRIRREREGDQPQQDQS